MDISTASNVCTQSLVQPIVTSVDNNAWKLVTSYQICCYTVNTNYWCTIINHHGSDKISAKITSVCAKKKIRLLFSFTAQFE